MLLSLASCTTLATTPRRILLITDFHSSPYYSPTLGPECGCVDADAQCEQPAQSEYGQYGCDPPYVLADLPL